MGVDNSSEHQRLSVPIEGDSPKQSFKLLRRLLPRRMHPYARGIRKWLLKEGHRDSEPFNVTYLYTQVSRLRQDSILEKASQLVADGVEGDFVECGVLDGGTAALLAYAARHDDRRIHLFDAWEGLPKATEKDGAGAGRWVGDVVGSPKRVTSVLRKVGANMENVVIHRGWFHETFPHAYVEKIAFLHVDCDFYDPTLLVLKTFVDRIVSGGYVQIDDYTSFEGCRQAVNEFTAARPDITLNVDDRSGGPTFFRMG